MDEIYFKDELLELPDEEIIALNKQVNDIGELSSRKSDFVREFKVKKTRPMEKLFENAGLINSQTSIPYDVNQCMLLSGGLEQIINGRLSLIRSDDDYYYCSIYSGAKNVFDEIGKLTLNDLDLSDLTHTWEITTQKNSVINDLDYQYLLFDPSDDGGLVPDVGDMDVDGALLRPFVRLKRIWDQIWIDQGITVTSDIDSNTLFLRMFQSISTLKTDSDNVATMLTSYESPLTTLPTGVRTSLNLTIKVYDPLDIGMYRARITGKFYFSLTMLAHFGTLDANVNTVQTPVDIISVEYIEAPFGLIPRIYFSIDLVSDDEVEFFYNAPLTIIWFAYCNCVNIEPISIAYNSVVEVEKYLEPLKQSDFVKAVCNYFSLIPDYDQLNNTINFWSLNNILKNRIVAVDWSNYLSVGEGTLTYSIKNYVQKNLLKWKENEDVSKGNGDYYLICNNQNLEKEKDLIKLPISFSDEIIHQAQSMARIGWYKTIEGSADYQPQDTISSRWVTREDMTIGIIISHELLSETLTDSQAKKANANTLSFGNNIGNFSAVQIMITDPKVLTLKTNLPSSEIAKLDHSKPVFFEQHSEYFYVNGVKNWIDGYICETELIRI